MKYRINIDYKNENPLDYDDTRKIARGVFEKLKRSTIDLKNGIISYKNIQKAVDRIQIDWDSSHPNNRKRKKTSNIEYGKYVEYLAHNYIDENYMSDTPKYMVNYYTWNYHIVDFEVTEDFIYPIPKYLAGVIDINFLFVPSSKLINAIDLARIYSNKYYKYTFIFDVNKIASISNIVKDLSDLAETVINILNKKFFPIKAKEILISASIDYWIYKSDLCSLDPLYIILNDKCMLDKRKENDNVVIVENNIKGKFRKKNFNNL